jgi:PQQ-dependent catabolism-associated CXXCW motif protein
VRSTLFLLALVVTLPALGQVARQAPVWPQVDEVQDFGVAPRATLRLDEHAAPTPLEIPGARTITTAELRQLVQSPLEKRALLFDAMGEDRHESLPGAIWLPGVGRGTSFDDEIQARLARVLESASGGDRARTLVFFCAGPRCWLSYNAALRAARLGYSSVRWYRGGIEAWGAGSGALTEPRAVWRRAP